MWGDGLDRDESGKGEVASILDCSNKPLGSIKCGKFLDSLKTC